MTGALIAVAVASVAQFPLRVAPIGAVVLVLVVDVMRRVYGGLAF